MERTRLYVCPEDSSEVLFREVVLDGPLVSFVVPDRPATCPKCRKSYYKWECAQREVVE